jgi:5-methylcytosine-specific restriction endonuclease McrA
MSHCILLNADYSFINMVSWRRAMCLMVKGKVQILSYSERIIRGAEGVVFQAPAVLRLIKLIRTIYRTRVPFSKRNVFIRDGFACAYCGAGSGSLTIDHILPRSRGGDTSFENCVACCLHCNAAKGCRTPNEAAMYLSRKPYQPTISEFLRMKFKRLGLDDVLRDCGLTV